MARDGLTLSKSILDTVHPTVSQEEPTEEIFDQLLEHLEESLMQAAWLWLYD